jgi:hypothetical protein
MLNVIKYGTAAGLFVAVYALAALGLWLTAWFVAPAGKQVAFRKAALITAIMIPVNYGLGFLLSSPYDLLLDFAVATLCVVFLLRLPWWRSALAAAAYEGTLFAAMLVVGLAFGRA